MTLSPRTGAQIVFTAAGTPMTSEHHAIPPLEPGQVLVRNTCTTLCRSDLSTWTGKRQEATPTVLGHEITGRIVAFGADAPRIDVRGQSLAVGDRITWAIFAADPASQRARAGMPQKAPGLFKYGHERLTPDSAHHGGLGEFTLLRANTPIARLEADLPDPVAALINCSVATVAGALRLAGELRDQRVLVSGAGMLGLCACAMSRDRGAASVTAVDIDPARLMTARRFGAHRTWLVRSDGGGLGEIDRVDVVLEFSGAPAAMAATLATLDIGGRAVWIGATMPQAPTPVDAEQVIRRLLSIRGLHNYNVDDFLTAVEFMRSRHAAWPFRELVHDAFTLADAEAAFRHAVGHNPLRVGVHIPPAATAGADGPSDQPR
jgi:putative phosphonate catabolism associated alcohol dehydrogenase